MFHPVKCLVLRHTRSKKPIETIYKLHGQVLSIVPSTVYLGLTIQDDGEWKKHIDNIESKGNQLLGFLRRNMRIDNKQAKQEAYKMLIRQPIEYGAVIWDPYHKTDIDKLERIQRRAARFVQGDFKQTSSVTAMINSLRWPSLEERRQELRINYLIKTLLTSHLCVVGGISTFRYGRKGSKRDEDVSPKNGHFFPLSPPTTRSLSWLGQILAWVVNRGLALTLYWM